MSRVKHSSLTSILGLNNTLGPTSTAGRNSTAGRTTTIPGLTGTAGPNNTAAGRMPATGARKQEPLQVVPAGDVHGDAAGLQDNTTAARPRTTRTRRRLAAASGAPHGGTLRLPNPPASPEPPGRSSLRGDRVITAFRPGADTVNAIITAAAIIACADGQVSDLERRSLLHFLRQKGILERKGRAAATADFNQAVALAVTLGLSDTSTAVDPFRALAARPGAPLVAHAAAIVALADGVGRPQEIALLEIIRDRLGLHTGSPPDVLH